MLSAAVVQAQPTIGTSFQLGNPASGTVYSGAFSMADERTSFDLSGQIDTIDYMIVCGVAQFASAPTVQTQVVVNGATYVIRTIKADPSAYILGLKKLTV